MAGTALTGLGVAMPIDQVTFESPAAHTVLETSAALIAGLVGLLLHGRYRRTAATRDLLLVYAMAIFALGTSALLVVPAVLGSSQSGPTTTWAAVLARLLGSLFVLAAALTPAASRHRVAHPAREVAGIAGLVVGMVALTVAFSAGLSELVGVPDGSSATADRLEVPPAVLVVQVVHLCCYAVASVRLTLGAVRQDDDLMGWLAAATVLGALSRLNYLVLPTIYTAWVSIGDLLRLGFFLLLLVGAIREIRSYWVATALAAAEAERRRLARDLHDGLLQELGYIRSEARRCETATGSLDRIVAAADRGLDEARRSLWTLTGATSESLADAIERSTLELARRYDAVVRLDLDREISVPPDEREQVVRIVREAVSNALRHAGGATVTVALGPEEVVVADDGLGFDPAVGRPGGFGLTSMRERADAIGARLQVESRPGSGTQVRVSGISGIGSVHRDPRPLASAS